MKILITGTAGFIGYHLAKLLCHQDHHVIGLDIINEYYDVNLKYDRLNDSGIQRNKIVAGKPVQSHLSANYEFIKGDIEDKKEIFKVFSLYKPEIVIHLAAQAGVRYSLTNPEAYISSNIHGFLNILEACRKFPVQHLIYASSSSVYGLHTSMPFSTHSNVDHPVSLYAASKKANELMAHSYSHLYGIPSTGLRFFTVYGPWGRPDMALFIFTKNIIEGKPIEVFNMGRMERDFTYVDDIIQGISRMLIKPPASDLLWDDKNPDPASSSAPFHIYNIGNNKPVKLLDFITAIEKYTGKQAKMTMKPIQPGDVRKTWADVSDLIKDFNFNPSTTLDTGVKRFIDWYIEYYKIKL
jgi:UDP-glucuronate 4-epimerase